MPDGNLFVLLSKLLLLSLYRFGKRYFLFSRQKIFFQRHYTGCYIAAQVVTLHDNAWRAPLIGANFWPATQLRYPGRTMDNNYSTRTILSIDELNVSVDYAGWRSLLKDKDHKQCSSCKV